MKKGLRLQENLSFDICFRWRWCPNEEGIKTLQTRQRKPRARVGGGALMKKGLRRRTSLSVASVCVGGGALMKKGLRLLISANIKSNHKVGGGALMKKGLRHPAVCQINFS